MKIVYQPTFLRHLRTFPKSLQVKVIDKVKLFAKLENHQALRVHKLNGRLRDRHSFSVTPAIRIIFCYSDTKPKEAHLLAVGSHQVYDL